MFRRRGRPAGGEGRQAEGGPGTTMAMPTTVHSAAVVQVQVRGRAKQGKARQGESCQAQHAKIYYVYARLHLTKELDGAAVR